jgi:uncharacterized protein
MDIASLHAVGAPNWFELATDDQAAATRFYAGLMGWQSVDSPLPDGRHYTIFRHGDREVAACYTMTDEQRGQGVPAHWSVYFHVADCDASAAKVRAIGGQVLVEPFEVMEHLRMAVVADPEGALFCLSQPRQHPGVGELQQPGSIGWVELATRDLGAAVAFYQQLFDWQLTEHPAPSPYKVFHAEGHDYGGLLQMTEQWGDIPAHWSIYLQVEDVDRALDRAVELGGSVAVPAFDIAGVGRIAMIKDTTGAHAYLVTTTA